MYPQCLLCDKCILWIKIFPFKLSLLELFQTKEDSLVRISQILSVWITATIHFACFWHSSQLKSLTIAFPPEQNTCPLVKIQSHVTIWASTQCPKCLHFRYVLQLDLSLAPIEVLILQNLSTKSLLWQQQLPSSTQPTASIVPFFPHSSPNAFSSYCRPLHWHAIVKAMMMSLQLEMMILFPPKQPSHVSDKGETNWTLADQVKRSCRGKRSLILGSTQNYSCPSMYR